MMDRSRSNACEAKHRMAIDPKSASIHAPFGLDRIFTDH
jgi:hypothetical protein